MGHLTVAGQSRGEIRARWTPTRGSGVTHILALRGDPPGGAARSTPHPDGLANATELVRLVKG